MSAKAKTKVGARMGDIRGEGRKQTSLLPETIDAYLGEATPVRLLDAFVEPLDLEP